MSDFSISYVGLTNSYSGHEKTAATDMIWTPSWQILRTGGGYCGNNVHMVFIIRDESALRRMFQEQYLATSGLGPEYLVLVLVVLEYLISVLVLVLVLRPLGT